MKAHFETFARYNIWANGRLYDAAAELSAAEFGADRGAFFGSMKGTLNHLLVTDRIWLRRITGEGPIETRLDSILFEDLPSLRAARAVEDDRYVEFIGSIPADGFDRRLSYKTTTGLAFEQPLRQVLAHVFNHQTHHRGQAHTILTGLGRAAPQLDLLYFLRET